MSATIDVKRKRNVKQARKRRGNLERAIGTLLRAETAWKPPDRIPPAEWCAANLWMPPRASAVRGRWNPNLFPYVRGPIDAFMDPRVEEIVLMWGSQLGKTMMLWALIGYVACNDPGPVLWAAPNETSCKEFSRMRLVPGCEESPKLNRLLLPEHLRQTLLVDLRDMVVNFAWSGSVTRLGEKSIRYLFCTEIDKWSREQSSEADSLALATERTKAFPNAKRIFESTPTIAGTSRIEARYEASDKQRFHVPCPHCGEFQELVFEQIKWPRSDDGKRSCSPDQARAEAYYECIACEKRILNQHRPRMLSGGKWVAERPTAHVAGFHLSSLYSPLLSFGRVAEAWLKACATGHASERQNIINSWLARTYSPPARETGREEILAHRAMGTDYEYSPDVCPLANPVAVVMTVDVQQESFYYAVRAWDADTSSALISYAECNTFEALYEASRRPIKLAAGGETSVTHVFIDSGYRTKQVYRVCRELSWNAIKGHAQERMKDIHRSETQGVILWSISDPHYCEELLFRIKEVELSDPGGWRLHNQTDTEYAKQLSCTRQMKKTDAYGQAKTVWVASAANHLWDCEKYQLAAVSILGIDRMTPAAGSPASARDEFGDWATDLDLREWNED